MYFAKMRKFSRTLAVRLTLSYASIFVAASLVAFLFLYMLVKSNIESRLDSVLEDQARECAAIMASKGIEGLKAEFINVSVTIGTSDIYLKLLAPDGHELFASDNSSWKQVPVDTTLVKRLKTDAPSFQTLPVPGHHVRVRALYALMPGNNILQIVSSLKENQRTLDSFRVVFITAIAVVMMLAIVLGYFIARRTLSKVEEVTQTATRIAGGKLDERVPLQGDGGELDQLAATFNGMLDRIQTLIKEMREINDNIAHDLRSPVTRLRGIAETTLTARRSQQDYEELAAGTVEECDRMLAMINTLLDISEAEGGVTKIDLAKCDVARLVKDACDLFQPVAEDKKVTIDCQVPGVCNGYVDVQKLQRALSNLLDNAIKFNTDHGHVSVKLLSEDRRLSIEVRDTGSGIPKADLPFIFERFYRSDRSRSSVGNGLGLCLARALIRIQGGDIQVTSELNSGSSFTIALPTA